MEYYYNTIRFLDSLLLSFKNEVVSTKSLQVGVSVKDCLSANQMDFINLLRNTITICGFFGVEEFDETIKSMEEYIGELENALRSGNKYVAQRAITIMIATFSEPQRSSSKTKLSSKLYLLDEDEKIRLNEAFNCYVNDLYYSAIVMSVSAVESRLFTIMDSIQMNSTQLHKNLDKLTLGGLITEYLENQDTYNKIIPQKHLQLLHYCNTYRVLSVHPKKAKISKSNANAILSMTCSFLFDESMNIAKNNN